jgi:hypothetical protein
VDRIIPLAVGGGSAPLDAPAVSAYLSTAMRAPLARLALLGRILCALALLGSAPVTRVVQDVAAEHAPAPPRRPPRPPLAAVAARLAAPAPAPSSASAGSRAILPARVVRAARPPGPPRREPTRLARIYLEHRALLL